MTRCRSAIPALGLFTSLAFGLSGCSSAETGDPFQGAGEFTLALVGADGNKTAQRMPSHPRLLLRHGKRGGTDLVLDRSCALRSVGGNITGTYFCRISSTIGPVTLLLQSGSWKITESVLNQSSDGCPLHHYDLALSASGIIQGKSGSTATLHFEGQRELKYCPVSSSDTYDSGPWLWTEDPYVSDGSDAYGPGYDWDGDGDWDEGGGTGGYEGDDGGDYEGGGGDDDGGGDDGGGDGGDGGDDGGDWDWATGRHPKSGKSAGRGTTAAAVSKFKTPVAIRDSSRPSGG